MALATPDWRLCRTVIFTVVPDRGYLPFYFVLTMCIASICGEVICRKTQVLVSLALIAALIVGIINVGRITYGYYSNADINKKNIEILSSTGKSISEGNNINSVVVYKMHDDNYPWMLPYSDEDSFMTIWMKFYYNIPQETELVWVDYEK